MLNFDERRSIYKLSKRKRIALITTNPESTYQQRVMEGVFSQCRKYGYDVAVFATLVPLAHYYKEYLSGELNIYQLINFDMFDGVIVTSISLSNNNQAAIFNEMLEKMKKECKCKVVAIDLPFGDYDVTYTDDRKAFSEITAHVLDVHKCKNVYFLTGFKDSDVSHYRLNGYIDELNRRGIPVDENKIFYGDFWYSSGEKLADDIHAGKIEMPEAVICASDHMALGLANRLAIYGVKIPEQIVITGYDATQEAAINDITITSYEPNIPVAAAEAVNRIHEAIEPDVPMQDLGKFAMGGLKIGESCGCTADTMYMKKKINESLYNSHRNVLQERDSQDISKLLESYIYEQFVNSKDLRECLFNIYRSVYLIRPYSDFYMCLKENWYDIDSKTIKGYPEKMRIIMHTNKKDDEEITENMRCFTKYDNKGEYSFDTKLMLPDMYEERDEPSVFYFSPVHFNSDTFGYSVVRNDLSQHQKINFVYRNWIRYINNALEMARTRARLELLSIKDMDTGLYNRRGLQQKIVDMRRFGQGKNILIIMADMDGLKNINDNFGHHEGDFGLRVIADSMTSVSDNNEICVRNGGDEFLLIGVGDYTKDTAEEKVNKILNEINRRSEESGKPYSVSASLGFCCDLLQSDTNIDKLMAIADEKMYENKRKRKKNRK